MSGTHGYNLVTQQKGIPAAEEVATQLTLRRGGILDHSGARSKVEGKLEEGLR